MRFVFFLLIIAVCIYIYARYVEPKWLEISTVDVASDKISEPQRIIAFGDTHVGHYFNEADLLKIVEEINAQEADAVVFLGDLVDNFSHFDGDIDEIAAVLSQLKCPTRLAVVGNHDVGGGGERIYTKLMNSAGFVVLRDENAKIGEINFIGAEESIFYTPDTVGLLSENLFNLVLSHEPDFAPKGGSFDMFVSGHTHGGQVYLPFFGAPIKPPQGKLFTRGMYDTPNGAVYVNRGIGTTQLPLRFLSRPQISVINIEPQS